MMKYNKKINNLTILEDLNITYTKEEKDILINNLLLDKVSNNDYLFTNSLNQSLYLSLTSILNENNEVIIFSPCKKIYLDIIKFNTSKAIIIDNINLLKKAINKKTRVILISYPFTYFGNKIDNQTFLQIKNISEKYNLFLIIEVTKMIDIPLNNNMIICYQIMNISYIQTNNETKQKIKNLAYLLGINVPSFIKENLISTNYDIKINYNFAFKILTKLKLLPLKIEGGNYLPFSLQNYQIKANEFCAILNNEFNLSLISGSYFLQDDYVLLNLNIPFETLKHILKIINIFMKKRSLTTS